MGNLNTPSDTGYDGTDNLTIPGRRPVQPPDQLAWPRAATSTSRTATATAGRTTSRRAASCADPGACRAPGPGSSTCRTASGPTDGRVFVSDRENDRIQIFSPDGEYLDEWTDTQRPTHIVFDARAAPTCPNCGGTLARPPAGTGPSGKGGTGASASTTPTAACSPAGGSADVCAPGSFAAPHSLAVDSRGDLYVAEVTWTFAASRGLVPAGCHTFQKFALKT